MLGSTLTTYQALSKLSLLALEAAVRVLQLLIARDSDASQPIETAFSAQKIEVLSVLYPTLEGNTEKLKNHYNLSELKFAIWVITPLAGWSGYQKQTPPGPITLHRRLRSASKSVGQSQSYFLLSIQNHSITLLNILKDYTQNNLPHTF